MTLKQKGSVLNVLIESTIFHLTAYQMYSSVLRCVVNETLDRVLQ